MKAIYQRAHAHSALYNDNEARRDFSRAERLDPQLKPIIKQELKKLSENLRAKHTHEKKNYWTIGREKRERDETSKQSQKKEFNCGEKSKNDRDKGQAIKIKSSDKNEISSSQTVDEEPKHLPVDEEAHLAPLKIGMEKNDRMLDTTCLSRDGTHLTGPEEAVKTDAMQ